MTVIKELSEWYQIYETRCCGCLRFCAGGGAGKAGTRWWMGREGGLKVAGARDQRLWWKWQVSQLDLEMLANRQFDPFGFNRCAWLNQLQATFVSPKEVRREVPRRRSTVAVAAACGFLICPGVVQKVLMTLQILFVDSPSTMTTTRCG